jgi:hypothetical protein
VAQTRDLGLSRAVRDWQRICIYLVVNTRELSNLLLLKEQI